MLHRFLPPHHPHPHRVAGETSLAMRNVRAAFKAFCRESANSSGASRASTRLLRPVRELPQQCVCVRGASGGRWGLKMLRLGEPRDVWMGSAQVGGCARASYCGIEARARIDPDRGVSPLASNSRPSLWYSARWSLSASLQEDYARARSIGRRSRLACPPFHAMPPRQCPCSNNRSHRPHRAPARLTGYSPRLRRRRPAPHRHLPPSTTWCFTYA
ncbi:hypothetical protein B0H14DRAFT_1646144 [Mycena olivaceomarginata]|nr:hypothetical protein B0H14DRAFT_1646144 [Mycena olivaceomarginata]